MISKETIKKILQAGVQAPSGENAQPWRFVVRGNQIFVFNIPERDQSLYNFRQLGSFVAHGCLIENIKIASSALGYAAEINLFPDSRGKNLVAIVNLKEAEPKDEPLYPCIFERCTNRKPYEKIPLTLEQKLELLSARTEIGGGEIIFEEDPFKIRELTEAASSNEKVMFNNKLLHQFFFEHLTWSEREYDKERLGFYIKTLEIPAPARIMLKLFRRWPIMKFFNKLGVNYAIAKTNAVNYSSSSAVGVVLTSKSAPADFVTAGRIAERLWLKATKIGLSVQPLTGGIFLAYRVLSGDARDFSEEQAEIIKNSYRRVKEIFNVGGKTIALMFRIGRGGEPSARSAKLEPRTKWIR